MASPLQPRFTPLVDSAYCNASNGAEILGITSAFLGVALISIVLRFYVRTKILKLVGAEDYTMLAAGLLAIGMFVCFVGETFWGSGRHKICVPPNLLWGTQMKWEFVHGICVVPAVFLVKIYQSPSSCKSHC